jgi:hypothetical protein
MNCFESREDTKPSTKSIADRVDTSQKVLVFVERSNRWRPIEAVFVSENITCFFEVSGERVIFAMLDTPMAVFENSCEDMNTLMFESAPIRSNQQ